jgi:hypothetical protein
MMPEGIVIIVENEPAKVETDLAAGVFGCPVCGGRLARWGHARRRWLRGEEGPVEVRPRRGRCVLCLVTQVFLPDVGLARRVDAVAVIGRALMAAAAGAGHRTAAAQLDRPASTVRGWLRRFRLAALLVAAHFTAWAHRLDPNLAPVAPAGSPLGDAVEAVGVAGRAASLRLGPRPGWSWASALTAGRLLSNTNSPWPVP